MKPKDELKRLAIIDKTIELVYQQGFAGIKMAELAKQVGISPSTLYVYYKSKEDLIVQIGSNILERETKASFMSINEAIPFKLKLKKIWVHWLNFSLNHSKEMSFVRQIKQSPYLEKLTPSVLESKYKMSNDLFDLGKAEGLLKELDNAILAGIVGALLKEAVEMVTNKHLKLDENGADTLFSVVWDAIKS